MTDQKENTGRIPSLCRENCPFQENCYSQGYQHCPFQKRSLIYLPLFYSISVHMIILYIILTLPIYSGGYRPRQPSGYSVYLKSEVNITDDLSISKKNMVKPDSRRDASKPKIPSGNISSRRESLPAVAIPDKPQPVRKQPDVKPQIKKPEIAAPGTDVSEKAAAPPAGATLDSAEKELAPVVKQKDIPVVKKEVPDALESTKKTPDKAVPEITEAKTITPEPRKRPASDLSNKVDSEPVIKDSAVTDDNVQRVSRHTVDANKEKPKPEPSGTIKEKIPSPEKPAPLAAKEIKASAAKSPAELPDATADSIDRVDRLKEFAPQKEKPVIKSPQPKRSSPEQITKKAPQPAESKPLTRETVRKDHDAALSKEKDVAKEINQPARSPAPEVAVKGGGQSSQTVSVPLAELKGPTIIELSPEIPDAQDRKQRLADSRTFDKKEPPRVAFSPETDDATDIFAAVAVEEARSIKRAPSLKKDTVASAPPKQTSAEVAGNKSPATEKMPGQTKELPKAPPLADAETWESTIKSAEELAQVIQMAIMEKVMHALEQADSLPPLRRPGTSQQEKAEEPRDKKEASLIQTAASLEAQLRESRVGKVLSFQRAARPLRLSMHEMTVSKVDYQFFVPVTQARTELTSPGEIDYDPQLYMKQVKKNIQASPREIKPLTVQDSQAGRTVPSPDTEEEHSLDQSTSLPAEPEINPADEQAQAAAAEPEAAPDIALSPPPIVEDIVEQSPDITGKQTSQQESGEGPQSQYTLSLPDESRKVMLETDLSIAQNPMIALDSIKRDFPAASSAKNSPPSNLTAADKSSPPALGIPVAEALIAKDVKIEMQSYGLELSLVPLSLFVRDKPSVAGKSSRGNKKINDVADVSLIYREKESLAAKRVLSLATAGNGTYTLVVENNSKELMTVDVIFRLFEGKKTERIKEYKSAKIESGNSLRFRFLLPDVIFWDDEDFFSGSVEDSHSITKFNNETGLVWKEEKDY